MRYMARHAARQAGVSGCILIPGDCPTVLDTDILDCIRALENGDLAITPALDGGYCMIGFRVGVPTDVLFDVTMGTSQTYSESVRADVIVASR